MRAAVPDYVGASFGDCPPGHRFGLYFPIWSENWEIEGQRKSEALKQTLSLPPHAQETLKSLRQRQAILLDAIPEAARLSIEAKSTAPFATGLGMEHPLENGFAFLNPYGLAYLPGGSIKGVLRRAAEELAGELIEADRMGWTQDAINALFGLESEDRQKEHTRGALSFWDVLPKPAKNSMGMEVMTPHYGGYYQGESTPHDSGQPIPIVFLVVPADSEFSFHLTCDTSRLPDDLCDTWQKLMRSAFKHAFALLGFGAKTAVGYGAMNPDTTAEAKANDQRKAREIQVEEAAAKDREAKKKAEAMAKLDPVERAIREFLDTRPDKNQMEISAVIGAIKQGRWQGEERFAVACWLKTAMQAAKGQWKETSQAKKPDKDREFQNTLLVLDWLQGK
jgi:CRISPR-associated protein Cmr6